MVQQFLFYIVYGVLLNLVKELWLVEDVQKPFRTLGHGCNAEKTILFLVKTQHEYGGQTQSEFGARLKQHQKAVQLLKK